jgi:LPXTG-site transpeptidase (sortase) family protein
MQKRGLLLWLGSALIFGGAAFLAVYWYSLHEATEAQGLAKAWLDASAMTRAAPAAPLRLPTHRPVRRGDVLGELDIPRLHLSVMVFEGDDPGILRIGAGHIPGTALPDNTGNIGIAAHRDTWFRPLRVIHANDLITLKTPAGMSRFAVTKTGIVPPADVAVLAQSPGRDLTLVTCYPFYYIGNAPQRFIVHARKIG